MESNKYRVLTLALIGFLLVGGIAEAKDWSDKQAAGKVVNTWTSAGSRVIQVQVGRNIIQFNERYWGAIQNPKIGDCVKMWIDHMKIPYSDRDLTPCDK